MNTTVFVLRTIHIESGTVTNRMIGLSYSIQKNVLLYYPKHKSPETIHGVLVGDNENIHQLAKNGYNYYIMTSFGETFEKVNIHYSHKEILINKMNVNSNK